MRFGLRCSQPARRPHIGLAASSCSYGREFALRCFRLRLAATPCGLLRLPSSVPVGSFHPTRFCPCWAHWGRRSVFVVCLAAIEHTWAGRPHKTMVCPTSESAKCRKSIAQALAGASLRTDYRGGPCARVPQKEWYAQVEILYHKRKDADLHVGPDSECDESCCRGRRHVSG